MNYEKIYNQLINTRINNPIKRKDQYCEAHHIIPKSMGGSNESDNIVNLTAREHFIAHMLLAKMYGNKMSQALWYMSNNGKYEINSHTYELNRKSYSKLCKLRTFTPETRKKLSVASLGENNPYFGLKHTDEIKSRMSKNQWLKNGKCTDEYRLKMSESLKLLNKNRTAEQRGKLGAMGVNNGYLGGNYYLTKTDEELQSISKKRSDSNKANKHNHMHKGGNKVVLFGIVYDSINQAAKLLGYSFKYLKRRVIEPDYKDCYFA